VTELEQMLRRIRYRLATAATGASAPGGEDDLRPAA
jgi:hypothetical protein